MPKPNQQTQQLPCGVVALTMGVSGVVSGVDLVVSATSATALQLAAWSALWTRLLEGGSVAPAVAGASLTMVSAGGDAQ